MKDKVQLIKRCIAVKSAEEQPSPVSVEKEVDE